MVKHLHHQIAILLGVALLFLGVFFGIHHTPKTEASTWFLSWWTVNRDNDNFIDATFWSDTPSDDDIIKALYGSGDEWSAYTQNRSGYTSGSCLASGMTVLYTDELSEYLTNNTIYVFDEEEVIVTWTRYLGNCSAIVTRNTNWTTFYSTSNIPFNGILSSNNKQHIILDFLSFDGTNDGIWGTHTVNDYWVRLQSSNNNTLHAIESYNNNNWISLYTTTNTTISQCETYNNGSVWIYIESRSTGNTITGCDSYNNWAWVYITTNSAYTKIFLSQFHHNQYWISINTSPYTTISDTDIYNNPQWLRTSSSSHSNIIDNHFFSNGYWARIYSSNNNFFDNNQFYNSTSDGIMLESSSNNAISNSQSYNNASAWIKLQSSSNNNILHNNIVYNNNYGVIFQSNSLTNIIHSHNIYNNSNNGILIDGSSSTVYYGNNRLFNNTLANIWWTPSNLSTGYVVDDLIMPIWRQNGKLIQSWTTSRDLITNPRNTLGNYFLSWSGTLSSIRGMKSWYSWTFSDVYSFGSGISLQVQPVMWSGTTDLIASWSFDPTQYIWSDVVKVTGEIIGLPTITSGLDFNILGDSSDSAISHYSLFGNIDSFVTNINIWDNTDIILTIGDWLKRIITQLFWTPYFATHFETDVLLDQTPPAQVTLVAPSSWSILSTGNIALVWNPLYDNETYYFEVTHDGDVVESGFVSTTWTTLSLPADDVYEAYQRHVYAIDILGNTWTWSDTRWFSIDTIICSDYRNNDAFITWAFWNTNPSDRCIIEALYGTTGDTDTAYTHYRTGYTTGSCLEYGMTVTRTWSIPTTLADYTIYVLESGDYLISNPTNISLCNTLITSGTATLTKNAWIHVLYFSNKTQYGIIDNLIIDGDGEINNGIHLDNTRNNTLHYIDIFAHTVWIRLANALYTTIDTVASHNNNYWIRLTTSSYNYIKNFSGYNNTFDWINIDTTSNNNNLEYFESHDNNRYGIAILNSTGNKVNNFEIYENSNDGIALDTTNDTYLYHFTSHHNNIGGIECIDSSNNIIEDFEIYNNWYKWIMINDSSYITLTGFLTYNHPSTRQGIWIVDSYNGIVSNFESYNNWYGIVIDRSSDNILDNFYIYNNLYWIYIQWSTNGITTIGSFRNTMNNFQSYNNFYYGVYIYNSGANNSLNNFQTYNNQYGVYINQNSSNNILHNFQSYNNQYGIQVGNNSNETLLNNFHTYNNQVWITNNSVSTAYYGTCTSFANTSSNTWGSAQLSVWTWLYFTSLWRNTGTLSVTGVMIWDFITNPINTSGDYLLWRSGQFFNLLWRKLSYSWTITERYSYGSGTLTQWQAVIYSWTTLITWETFDATKYIWSDVVKVTGDTQIVPTYTRYTWLTLTGISADPLVDRYSFFGHLNSFPLGQTINTTTWIQLTSGDGTKYIIDQLWNDDYFATHFQKNTFLDQTPPSQVILVSPLSWTVFDTWNVSLERDISIDTWAGFSWYLFEISTGIWFSETLYSWSTSDTGFSLFDLSNGNYYRRVYAIDVLGNITPSATIWNFIIELCGNNALDIWEDCDQWWLNSTTWACSTSCMWNTPSCTLSVDPLTGYVPLNADYTISDVDTWWMSFDRLEFGDGTTWAVNTGTLLYSHIYTDTWTFTWILQVSNRYKNALTGQCEVSLDISTYEYCGDGIVQSPNSDGEYEVCDGEVWCDSFCQREDISCTLNISSPLYSWENTLLTGTANHSRALFSGINFGLPNILYTIDDIWSYTTWHQYSSWWTYTITMDIVHPSTGWITSQCIWTIDVLRCGDNTINGTETCDDGSNNGVVCTPWYGSTCNYCSLWCEPILLTGEYCGDGIVNGPEQCDSSLGCTSSCTRDIPSCTLSINPLTWFAPLTWEYTLSNVDTWWMQFDRIDFGDSTTWAVNTGTLTYTHTYTLAGIFTGTLYISNSYDSSRTGQCSTVFTALCQDIAWTPDPSTICSPNIFTQTSNCGVTRQATGTRSCGWGWGTTLQTDDCCSYGGLPWANTHCEDYSPSYYDDTCLALDTHEAAWSLCDYDDENYFGNGSFTDTTNHRWFPYIEIMRLSCLHRWVGTSKDKWIYSPNTYIKKSEILKTLVKIMGIAFEDFDITTEDKTYPHTLIFKDLTPTHRFSRYSAYAYTRWLTEGLYQSNASNLYLSPDLYVSRNDIVKKIIEVYTTINNGQVPLNSWTNLSDISPSDPYYSYIRQAESLGFIEGFPQADESHIFAGGQYVTRAAFAKMIAIPFSALLMGEEE